MITAVFYIITSRENLYFFTQTPHSVYTFFFCGITAVMRSRPPDCWGYEILHTASHTTFGRIPLDEGSVRRRDLHSQQTHTPMHPAGFETAIPASSSAADLRLRTRGCWNQRYGFLLHKNIPLDSNYFSDNNYTVELHLSGLIATASHPDMQEIRLTVFF
jgi:hypothetical protein